MGAYGLPGDFSIIGPVLSGYASKAIRGVMANLEVGLALAFQVNPQEIQNEKTTDYDVDQAPGFNGPIITWKSGGLRKIKFNLFFDTTPAAVSSGLSIPSMPSIKLSPTQGPQVEFSNVPIPGRGRPGSPPLVGARGIISIIDSFLEPAVPLLQLFGSKTVSRPPPDCYLILGTRFWRTKLSQAPYREILHDKLLTPLRLEVSPEFWVLEEGEIQDANLATRKVLAAGESTVGFASSFLTVF